jgi:hypothetical protein
MTSGTYPQALFITADDNLTPNFLCPRPYPYFPRSSFVLVFVVLCGQK